MQNWHEIQFQMQWWRVEADCWLIDVSLLFGDSHLIDGRKTPTVLCHYLKDELPLFFRFGVQTVVLLYESHSSYSSIIGNM